LGIKKSSLIPNRFQSSVELMYEFVSNMVKENVGNGGKKYFPFIFSLFMFILF
jgi:F-type H+-transporting ATPase subunit a